MASFEEGLPFIINQTDSLFIASTPGKRYIKNSNLPWERVLTLFLKESRQGVQMSLSAGQSPNGGLSNTFLSDHC